MSELPWPDRFKRNLQVVEIFAEGLSLREMSDRVDITHSAIVVILREVGLKCAVRRSTRPSRKALRNTEMAKAHALGKSFRELAERYQISRQRCQAIVAAQAPSPAVGNASKGDE